MNFYILMGFYTVLVAAVLAGWVLNILNIIAFSGEITGLLVIQVIGVFIAPLGVVLGYVL